MKLQNQVCSLEQAEKLRGLGVIQDSLFSWVKHKQTAFPKPSVFFCGEIQDYKKEFGEGCFGIIVVASAFTVAELVAMLPPSITISGKTGTLSIDKCDESEFYGHPESYVVGYCRPDKDRIKEWIMGSGRDSLAESAADILIMLIEKGIVQLEVINQRLQNA